MTQQINLYNPAFRRVRDLLSASAVTIVAAVCVALVLGLSSWAQWQARQRASEAAVLDAQLKQEQAVLAAMTVELSAPHKNAQLEAELAAATLALQGREDVVRALRNGVAGNPDGYAETLQALARQAMPGLWLTGFTIADGGSAMTLRGRSLDPAQVPAFIKRLAAEKAFQGRQIAEISMQDSSLLSGAKTFAAVDARQNAAVPLASRARFTEFVLTGSNDGGKTTEPTNPVGAKP
jgi:Tfp pilus assembly protein PilN